MYLELAEGNDDYLQNNDELYLDEDGNLVEGEEEVSPYIFVPGTGGDQGVYVREDYFDDLPDIQWEQIMETLETNQPGMSFLGMGKKARARRIERRERRQERKIEKIGARGEKRALVARAGGGLAGLGQGLSGVLGNIFGGGQAGGEIQSAPRRNYTPWIIGGIAVVGLGGLLIYNSRRRRRR